VQLRRIHVERRLDDRILGGVAAGLGDAFDLDPNVVRCGFVVLTLASGLGVFLYGAAWALIPAAPHNGDVKAERGGIEPDTRTPDALATVAFAAVVLGMLLLVRSLGVWPGDVIVWPLAGAMVGLAVLASHAPADATIEPPPWLAQLPPDAAEALTMLVGTRRGALARLIAGAGCFIAGIGAFIVSVDSWRAFRGGLAAAIALLAGVALVLGPGLWRLAHALAVERRERIRSEERAEVAAHLHDSVLQTLALVQRRADDPREVVRLARMQERELRAWLLGGGPPAEANGNAEHSSLGSALDELAAALETDHGVPVEVVRVRDCPLEGLHPLLAATREAIVNAARHSGAPSVSVYLEVEPDRATIFVRDRGRGFDPAAVASDRSGISGSIVGRLTRAGGTASVRSTPGEGTEVELMLPRARVGEPS
jgi:signal transduction histidine kinase/phage shock protein PspC (stress-responsive transcriptional regulator)